MTEGVIELALTDEEQAKFQATQTELQTKAKEATTKAYDFAELLTIMVNAVNAANEAQAESRRLLKRAAKARFRQPEDIVDLDIPAKTIVFKKTKKELAADADTDTVPEGD